jgi:hypothetical protein
LQLAALGDRLGGWDSRDHDIFIKIWTQFIGTITRRGTNPSISPSPDASSVSRGPTFNEMPIKKPKEHVNEEYNQEKEEQIMDGKVAIALDLSSKSAMILKRRLAQSIQMKTEEEIENHLKW